MEFNKAIFNLQTELFVKDKPTYRSYLHPDGELLYVEWIWSYIDGYDIIYDGAKDILAQVEKHNILYILNDNTDVEGVWDKANDWIAKNFTPVLKTSSAVKYAHILSSDFFAELSAELLVEVGIEHGIAMKTFGDRVAGLKWLGY